MRISRIIVIPLAVCLTAGLATLAGQDQGPAKEGSETVARPRNSTTSTEPAEGPKIPSKFEKKDIPAAGTPSFKSNVTAVTVDVAVLDNKGRFIPNIPRGNFRVLEDGVPQQVTNFSMGEAPMTVAMVIEFSNRWQSYWTRTWYQTLQASWGFLESLKQEDYVAIIAYDMHPEILCDFTQDRREAMEAMRRLQIPAFSEANFYDALTDTAQRMSSIEGRKAIVTITSGIDTFSKLTLDKTRKILQNAGVPIYAIGIGQAVRIMMEGQVSGPTEMDWLQADNTLNTFTRETGGQVFLPRFEGEFPGIFRAIAQALRNQYSLAYNPSNQARDGSFRKLKVELVNPATGEPLKITENNKPIKYTIIAKGGYTAPREVE
ncbi:MAG: VWA domain-containing protein [Bryobacteraceae bacterium]|jgi:VWFA-related protein